MKLNEFYQCMAFIGEYEYTDNPAKNQIIMYYRKGSVFYSYGSLIGAVIEGQLYLTKYHEYSRTTSYWTKRWCYLDLKQRREGIKNKEIEFVEYTSKLI